MLIPHDAFAQFLKDLDRDAHSHDAFVQFLKDLDRDAHS
jgi:hypothetical protein